jgi:hypothetical protein
MSPEDVAALVIAHGGDVLDLDEALRLAGHHWTMTYIIPLASQVLKRLRQNGDVSGDAKAAMEDVP